MNIYGLPLPKNKRYLDYYIRLIQIAQKNTILPSYTENHHIVPRSMNGTDDPSNLVKLSARQHYVAHLLLWKAYGNAQMTHAFWMMCNRGGIKSSHIYEAIRTYRRELFSGKNHPYYGQKRPEHGQKIKGPNNYFFGKRFCGEDNGFFGRQHTAEQKIKWSESKKGKNLIDFLGEERAYTIWHNHSENMKGDKNPFFGKKHSQEVKDFLSNQMKNSPKLSCPFCNKIVDKRNAIRWHFSNCKFKAV